MKSNKSKLNLNKKKFRLVSVRPNDSRGWIALSANELKLGNHKKAYYIAKTAKSLGDRERLADELTKVLIIICWNYM